MAAAYGTVPRGVGQREQGTEHAIYGQRFLVQAGRRQAVRETH